MNFREEFSQLFIRVKSIKLFDSFHLLLFKIQTKNFLYNNKFDFFWYIFV